MGYLSVQLVLAIIAAFTAVLCQSTLISAHAECKAQRFDADSVACICDEIHCDYNDPKMPEAGQYLTVASSKGGLRFQHSYGYLVQSRNPMDYCGDIIKGKTIILSVNRSQTYQKTVGFGGAFTDIAGFNIARLSPKVQEQIFRSYYSDEGLKYNLGRVPIGHTDFSVYEYYFDNVYGDINLLHFALTDPEYKYKIPYIKKAMNMTKDNLLLMASIWSPPLWMKEKDGTGKLTHVKDRLHATYSKYIIRFLQEYKKLGIEMWTVAAANEPILNLITPVLVATSKDATCWPFNKLAQFVVNYLGPMLRESGFRNTKIMNLDDNRFSLLMPWLTGYLEQKGIDDYLEYVGLHAYADKYISGETIDDLHQLKPNTTIIMTEFSTNIDEGVKLGSWKTAEDYIFPLMDGFRHWTSGFIDWNLVLDTKGGPSFVGAKTDALIVADHINNRIYKQPSFYAFGHFSKFIPRGSKRIHIEEIFPSSIQYTAVVTPQNRIVVVLYNAHDHKIVAQISDIDKGEIVLPIPPKTIYTVVY